MTDETPDEPLVDEDGTEYDGAVHRPFAAFLAEHAKGVTHSELTEQLAAVVTAVRDTGKPGALQLTIKIRPMKSNDEVLLVSDVVRATIPKPDKSDSVFYADDAGNLVRDNPNQPDIPGIREVVTRPKTVKSVPAKEKRA